MLAITNKSGTKTLELSYQCYVFQHLLTVSQIRREY